MPLKRGYLSLSEKSFSLDLHLPPNERKIDFTLMEDVVLILEII